MEQHKRVWIYCRVANPDTEALNFQKEKLLSSAVEQGFEVVGITTEIGSGLHIKRDGMDEVFSAAENGCMDTLFVVNSSRIARETSEIVDCVARLNEQKVELLILGFGPMRVFLPHNIALYWRISKARGY